MKRQLALSILLLLAAWPAAAAAAQTTEIIVTGTGSVSLAPNQAIVDATIQTNAETAAAAMGQNNAAFNRISAALERQGVQVSDVRLSSYALTYNPRPSPAPQSPPAYERYGFTVTRSLSVLVRRVDKAGSVIDAATGAGATGIDVSFGVADSASAQSQATAKATQDARRKAEVIAKAAGLRIVGIARLQLGGSQFVSPEPLLRMAAAAPPTVLTPSNVTFTSSVTATYLAGP
jgi:uncharacterized protein YggE